MAKTLIEYAEWLDDRKLIWPAPPKRVPITAKPSIGPLAGIRAVAFSVYGTLLRISDGAAAPAASAGGADGDRARQDDQRIQHVEQHDAQTGQALGSA